MSIIIIIVIAYLQVCALDGRNTNQQYELSWNSFMNEHLLFNEVLLLNGSKKKIEYIDKRDIAEKGFRP